MRSWLRSREGHVWPKRSPYEGDTPFCWGGASRAARVRRVSVSLPLRPVTPRDGRKFRFPAQSFDPRAFFTFGSHPFVFFVLLCRGDAVAMVNNNTPYFGMAVKFSRPKWRKSDHDGECLKRPGRSENGYGHVSRILVAPNSGMVSKIRGKMGIFFCPGQRRIASGRATQPGHSLPISIPSWLRELSDPSSVSLREVCSWFRWIYATQ